MSATNRTKSKADRLAAQPLDFYETPAHAIAVLVDVLSEELPQDADRRSMRCIVDAGCGTGVIGLEILRSLQCNVLGAELDKRRSIESNRRGLPTLDTDFKTMDLLGVDHVVGNPPFSEAVAFIHKGLSLVGEGGLVSFLLRLNFLGSGRKRYDLLAPKGGLYRVDVLTDRPSFCTSARCDACGETWQFPAGKPLKSLLHPPSSCGCAGTPPNKPQPAYGGSRMYKASRTDSVDYAWVTWKKGFDGDARIRICPSRKETK